MLHAEIKKIRPKEAGLPNERKKNKLNKKFTANMPDFQTKKCWLQCLIILHV
jgi:hypothetical protein